MWQNLIENPHCMCKQEFVCVCVSESERLGVCMYEQERECPEGCVFE